MKLFALSAAALFLSLAAAAQTPLGYVQVTGSHMTNSSGLLVENGTIAFAPVNSTGQAIGYQVNGQGHAITSPVVATVAAGAFSILLADTSLTTPQNVCFSVSVTDKATNKSVLGPGYTCFQPAGYGAPVASGLCAAATSSAGGSCNFDLVAPNIPSLAVIQTGPAGPIGPPGPTGPPGPPMPLVVTCTGSNDSTAIQAALTTAATKGGHVMLSGSTCGITARLTMSCQLASCQGVWLDMGATTLVYNNGSSDFILGNAVPMQRSCTDAVVTAASNTITSATCNFSAADVGADIVLPGAMNPMSNVTCTATCTNTILVGRIISVTNATTAVIGGLGVSSPQVSLSPATINIWYRDHNLTITGGNLQLNGQNGTPVTVWRGVNNLTIKDITVGGAAWSQGMSICAATNVSVYNSQLVAIAQDALDLYGPIQGAMFHDIRDFSYNPMRITSQGCYGWAPIQEVVMDKVVSSSIDAVFFFSNDSGYIPPVRNLTFTHFKAIGGSFLFQFSSGAAFDNILIDDAGGALSSGGSVVYLTGGTVGTLVAKNLSNDGGGSFLNITPQGGVPVSVNNLILDGLY